MESGKATVLKQAQFTQNQNDLLDFMDQYGMQNEMGKPSSENDEDGLYLFISFDIVNSTWMKNKEPEKWPIINSEFYDSVKSCFSIDTYDKKIWKENSTNFKELLNRGGGFRIWKLVGDEVVIYCRILASEVLYEAILFADQAKTEILNKMKMQKLLKGSSLLESFALKTSIWIADCGAKEKYKNIIYDPTKLGITSGTPHVIDFLGPDMDEGFRLTRLSEKNKVLVSPKLVYTMYKYFDSIGKRDKLEILKSNFKIIKYETLKGVWEERPYPVIVFHHSFEENYLDDLEYDEILSSSLCSVIRELGFQRICQDEIFSINRLEKIFKDMNLTEEMNRIQEYLQDADAGKLVVKRTRTLEERQFFQIVCVCHDEEKDLFFLEKDENNCWSFGHHVPRSNIALKESLMKGYKQSYDIDLVPERTDLDNILHSYSIKNKVHEVDEYIFCVVVEGCIKQGNDISQQLGADNQEKKVAWYSLQDIEEMLSQSEQHKFVNEFESIFKKIKSKKQGDV